MPHLVASPVSRGLLTGLVEDKPANTGHRVASPDGTRAWAIEPPQRTPPTDNSATDIIGSERAEKLAALKQRRTRMLSLTQLFRLQVEKHTEVSQMTDVLRALMGEARVAFDLAADVRRGRHYPEDEACCLDHLAGLLRMFKFDQRPPFNELFHATDSLIVECVRLEMLIDPPRAFRDGW